MEQFLNFCAMLVWFFGVGFLHLRLIQLVLSIVVIKAEPEPRYELSKEAIEGIRRRRC